MVQNEGGAGADWGGPWCSLIDGLLPAQLFHLARLCEDIHGPSSGVAPRLHHSEEWCIDRASLLFQRQHGRREPANGQSCFYNQD